MFRRILSVQNVKGIFKVTARVCLSSRKGGLLSPPGKETCTQCRALVPRPSVAKFCSDCCKGIPDGWCPPKPEDIKPLPPNPCCPIYPHGNYKPYRFIFFFVCLPTIGFQMTRVFKFLGAKQEEGHRRGVKDPCRHFEYMRRRSKKYPWRDGIKTLFHNDEVNSLPEECTNQPQPQDCEDYV